MRSYIERAIDFIHEIDPLINNIHSYASVFYAVAEFNNTYHRNVIFCNGAVRYALLTSDYVIKFDYEPEEVESLGGCEDEVKIYEKAQEEGFGYLFCPITRYVYGHRFYYIMPRVRGVSTAGCFAWNFMTEEEEAWCKGIGLSDLHEDNYGFRDGHVCLIDYACHFGYEDCESSYDFYNSDEEEK